MAVDCSAKWSREAIYIAGAQGPHPTANSAGCSGPGTRRYDYQVKARFTKVVFLDEIKDDLPVHFKVLPVAVIPQTGCRGQIILDLSFPVRRPPQKGQKHRMGEVVQELVNGTRASSLLPSPFTRLARCYHNWSTSWHQPRKTRRSG
jgi:hypothetical protein